MSMKLDHEIYRFFLVWDGRNGLVESKAKLYLTCFKIHLFYFD